MKRCCIFSRVSSLHQSVDEQTKELLNEASRNGFKEEEIITIEWTESAIKLNLSERNSIQKLFQIIDENPIECIICRELSRIARRPDVLYSVRDFLIERRIQLIVCNPYMKLLDNSGKLSQTASIMFSLFSSIAESEMAIKKERFHEGKLRKKNQGKWAGGFLPFGYKYERDTHFIYADPKEAEVVRLIFDMYVNRNMSTVKIARHLNTTGQLNCCKTGSTVETAVSTIGSMLKNKAYIGDHPVYRGKIVDNIYPPIVTKEIFDAAAAKLRNHNSRKNKTVEIESKHIYFCRGILVDSFGNKLVGKSAANAYRYVRHDIGGESYQITVPINMVDSLVWHFTNEYIDRFTPDTIKDAESSIHNELIFLTQKSDTIKNKIEAIEGEYERLNTMFQKGRITEEVYDQRYKEIDDNKEELETEWLSCIFEMTGYQERIKALGQGYASGNSIDDEQKYELIHQFVEKVEVVNVGWGKYELDIIFKDGYSEFVKFSSMGKTAEYISGGKVQFEYVDRFVRTKK